MNGREALCWKIDELMTAVEDLTAEREDLKQQNADLLAACELALPILRQWESDGELATAAVELAIAKAKGGEL